jgi:hypothetical protein
MPFSHVRNSYQPEQLDKLTDAFNLVWPQVVLANGTATDIELERIRHRLANFIVACASRGEFEPEKLRQTAPRAFLPKSSRMPDEKAAALPPAYSGEVSRLA